MSKKGTEIVKFDLKKLIALLNKALADEWFAYYQYWVGAKVVKGVMRSEAVAELTEHAGEELKHAEMLAERIIQLGGTPITNPNNFAKMANCDYLEPKNFTVKSIITQGVSGERCAIDVYNQLLDLLEGKDLITYQMIAKILQDEIEHEADFMALLEDLK